MEEIRVTEIDLISVRVNGILVLLIPHENTKFCVTVSLRCAPISSGKKKEPISLGRLEI